MFAAENDLPPSKKAIIPRQLGFQTDKSIPAAFPCFLPNSAQIAQLIYRGLTIT
jgi:hypothetical protein